MKPHQMMIKQTLMNKKKVFWVIEVKHHKMIKLLEED